MNFRHKPPRQSKSLNFTQLSSYQVIPSVECKSSIFLKMEDHVVEGILSEFIKQTKNPEIYIEPQFENANRFKQLVKQIYHFTVAPDSLSNLKAKSLRDLLTEGFDNEQIWQQIEILNNAALAFFPSKILTINPEPSKDVICEDFFDVSESGHESIDGTRDYGDGTRDNDDIMSSYKKDDSSEDSFDEEMEEDCEMENKVGSLKAEKDTSSANTLKTAFELEQEKVRLKIKECEKSMLEPMSWQLTGEVAASNRPIDSLVHQETEFDSNVKQDLIMDNTVNERVEAIIKMTIKNKGFCDVERKIKPTEDIIAYKKEIALDQTKSKKSLAEVYEEDYLKKQTKQEEEEDPKHKEVKKVMDSLFPELYALFTHIPKPAIPEIKIVSNLPAITVEEVAPTSISNVTLLAPEEVKKKVGLVKGQTERTDTDRKHERRKKKIHQKLKEKKKQNTETSRRMSKQKKLEDLKKLKQNKNTKIADVDKGQIKSSKDFFSRLQETMDSKTKCKVSFKKKTIQ